MFFVSSLDKDFDFVKESQKRLSKTMQKKLGIKNLILKSKQFSQVLC